MSVVALISGRGSNLRALVEAGLPVSGVISNVADAKGLEFARSRNIATRGRNPRLTNGAAGSSGSNVSSGARPGSDSSRTRAYSLSAAAGLSRIRCIACVVADHAA